MRCLDAIFSIELMLGTEPVGPVSFRIGWFGAEPCYGCWIRFAARLMVKGPNVFYEFLRKVCVLPVFLPQSVELCRHCFLGSVCFVLFCFVLFCFVLFCSVLFCSVLFCFVLFCSVLFCFVLFCFVLFCFVLFVIHDGSIINSFRNIHLPFVLFRFAIIIDLWVWPPPRMPVANEGLVRNPPVNMFHNPGGHCEWEGATSK